VSRASLSPNVAAFLDMIALSEIGRSMLDDPLTDDGYKVIVGSRPGKLILMQNYAEHPNKLVEYKPGKKGTAAGRYQLLFRYYRHYRDLLGLGDFSPVSQDRIAVRQIAEFRALQLIEQGHFEAAVDKVKPLWASLPGAGYGQHEQRLPDLIAAYTKAGGSIG
jgi:muramidase (phage lysozyme)